MLLKSLRTEKTLRGWVIWMERRSLNLCLRKDMRLLEFLGDLGNALMDLELCILPTVSSLWIKDNAEQHVYLMVILKSLYCYRRHYPDESHSRMRSKWS
jgi:hypothetical protein